MSSQTLYSIAAACCGFISAIFFAVGSAFTSQQKIVALSGTYWNFNPVFAAAAVSQSTQYAIGALLLFVAFLLQVVAALAPPTIPQAQCPVLANAWLFVLSILAVIGLPAWLSCVLLTKWRLKKVLEELSVTTQS
ncbi:hypothetical protein [Accumulibacter sp.]|uniref:hypothetical protein n=1 Tax=Accumulibacter sp. TaxID=2053492 RepID=UPI002613B79B|nr:hypothetical protein [Accumulibacter sp.]